jgi:hypothetical protein
VEQVAFLPHLVLRQRGRFYLRRLPLPLPRWELLLEARARGEVPAQLMLRFGLSQMSSSIALPGKGRPANRWARGLVV